MRVDVFLNAVCLLKSRSMAKEACDRGKVTLNGERVKASHGVTAGDRVALDLGVRLLEVEVVEVPPRQVSRKEAHDYYRVVRDERPDLDEF